MGPSVTTDYLCRVIRFWNTTRTCGLVEGSTVFGFFRDGDACQLPVIIGSAAGIPQVGFKEGVDKKLVSRKITDGFNDPRKLTGTVKDKDGKDTSSYSGTPDGANPEHAPTRGFGLEHALDTAPIKPEKLDITYLGKGSTYTNPTLTEDSLPRYPLYMEESDLSKFARGDEKDGENNYAHRSVNGQVAGQGVAAFVEAINKTDPRLSGFPSSRANPVYPYNKVTETESGHMIELDDTPKFERIAVEHRTGTFHEIHPNGSQMTRIVNDRYTVVCANDEVYIGGNVTVNINGNADIKTYGDVKLKGYGKGEIDVTGTMDIKSGDNMTLQSAKVLFLKGQVIQEGS